jgi:hypothetical protein
MPIDGSDRMRGHGALLGAIDTTIHVVKGHDLVRTATVIKANDSEEGQRIAFDLESVLIGTDAEGNHTTAPVVVFVAATTVQTQKPSRSLPKSAQIALRALAEALEEQGERAPASNHIPHGVKVIKTEVWRQHAYRRGISGSEEERARQQAFKRAAEHLISAGRVGIWDNSVWLVG